MALEKTQEYVEFYIDFVNWLSEITFGFVPRAVDPNLDRTKHRKLTHSKFIAILKHLQTREQLIAQLLYYGGYRNVEEILSLKIEDVHALLGHVTYSGITVPYPKHVLKDLQAYISSRRKGYVFIGRNKGEKLAHPVPFRALKTAISRLGLNPAFTFTDFVKNI